MASSLALVIFLAGGSVMALPPAARAAVMGWIFGQEGNAYTYRSTGAETNEATLITYDFSQIPEGYTLWEKILMPNSGFMLYSEESTGMLLKVFFSPNDGSGALYLIPEDATRVPVQLGNISADFYQSNTQQSSSTIVWTVPENDYLVCVDGFFSQEELMNMALNLVKETVLKPE